LHTLDATETINRIVSVFPPHQHQQVRLQLSSVLRAVVSQRLIPKADGKGRVPAVEVMINSPLIADLILKGEIHGLKELMAKSTEAGMQTFDQSLFNLHEAGLISYDEALRNADSVNDLRLRLKLEGKDAKGQQLGDSMRNVTF
jgi:twitching motility protein PilU